MDLRAALLREVPDAPATLALRALLLDPESAVAGAPDGAVVRSGAGLVAVWGSPWPGLLRAQGDGDEEVLAAHPLDLGPGWRWERAAVHALAGVAALGAALREAAGTVVPLERAHLEEVEPALRAELAAAARRGPVACALAEGVPASFASAPLRTETLFDVSVDTLPPFRGRGLARRAAAVLIAAERAAGREPVWGAAESNGPLLQVGQALGFRLAGHLWVAEREEQGAA
jgi:GNAT superfamily N-acetyltransferase